MAFHKLKDGPITLTVASCDQVEGNFGPQYLVTGTDGTGVYVNVASFDRQLARLSLNADTVVGETIRMEQVQKNGTTFTNVYKANASEVGASAPTARAAAPAARPAMTVAEAGRMYQEALMAVYQPLADACGELQVPVTAEALNAAAATVMIAAKGR